MTSRSRRLSRALVSGVLLAAVGGLVAATSSSPAQADDRTVFKVVGTTDVFDSHLVQEVIEPDFESKYPDIDLQYISQGTGPAITTAKSGVASALIVHAAALENQFVDQGYSLEQYGRAIFWGDYVLLGPKSDPAGVLSGGQPSHDVAAAFQKIAAAGAQGKADFVSRGGTPGTSVQEHAIWALTSGVPLCTVPTGSGGGKAPGATDGGNCKDYTGTTTDTAYPSWYHVTGSGQADNINNGNLCNYTNGGNGTKPDCYVFTDRGTFNFLQSQDLANRLQVVTRDNDNAAPGGQSALVNSFHAYAINPDGITSHGGNASAVDTVTATKFLNFLTSASEQQKIGNYLGSGRSAAFIPSAMPLVTASALPASDPANTPLTITGSIANAVPGTPALDGVQVTLVSVASDGTTTPLATDNTTSTGGFTFQTTFNDTTTYAVQTPEIHKVEDSTLNPVFGDILTAGQTTIGTVNVQPASTITQTKRTISGRTVTVTGKVSPAASGSTARVKVYLGKGSATPTHYKNVALKAGAKNFSLTMSVKSAGTYSYYLTYANNGVIVPSSTPTMTFTVK